MNPEQIRQSMNSFLTNYRVNQGPPLAYHLYIPSDFREPEQQEFISITIGTSDYKKFYPSASDFWVTALFNFVEDQMQDQKFEEQATQALCELVGETVMRRQVQNCLSRLDSRFSPDFIVEETILVIYRMFNYEDRISYVVKTAQGYYAFFWEKETGTYCAK